MKYRVAWLGGGIIMHRLGPDYVMISSCRCYGVPDLLRVPSPSSCRMGSISKGSADTVLVLTLRFARCSFLVDPGSEGSHGGTPMPLLERCNRRQNGTTLYHNYVRKSLLPHFTTLYSTTTKTNALNSRRLLQNLYSEK
jgi:hypothetical protein